GRKMNRSVTRSTLAHRPGAGQGLVEFSLIMPFLLVLFMGILDFGRVFFVYSEVSSAVREAIRFSAVNPLDCVGIRQRAGSTLTLTDVADIDLTLSYDNGETAYFTYDAACAEEPPEPTIGDRITLRARTSVQLISGYLFNALMRQSFPALPIEYVSSRTIVPSDGIETGPTSTPLPTRTARPGASPTPTHTWTPTATPTPEPPPAPIDFAASVKCQNSNVSFEWQTVPDATNYTIYNADTGLLIGSSTSGSCNNCDNLGTSQARSYYVVASNAGGSSPPSNVSSVACGAGATDTPTPTNTLTPTPSDTPRPTRTPAPTLAVSETPMPPDSGDDPATPTPSPTPTTMPPLKIAFEPGYPLYNKAKRQFWVYVYVTNPVDYPVIDADVLIVEPPSYNGTQLTHVGNGVYGLNATCFSGSTTATTYIRVSASRFSYASAEVAAYTVETNAPKCPAPTH
ncbi:MAG TPA: TadE/TadG family type IV pilus assembly protein, partial [Anaerolineae bacterium]|nr:TadE/TadG family type IV pilus assembly protein [Anaerolineae bacterium]